MERGLQEGLVIYTLNMLEGGYENLLRQTGPCGQLRRNYAARQPWSGSPSFRPPPLAHSELHRAKSSQHRQARRAPRRELSFLCPRLAQLALFQAPHRALRSRPPRVHLAPTPVLGWLVLTLILSFVVSETHLIDQFNYFCLFYKFIKLKTIPFTLYPLSKLGEENIL